MSTSEIDHNNGAASRAVDESEDFCRRFSIAEIQSATNNFDDALVIGNGGFGKVYKGFINNGVVAIKRLNAESKQGAGEFWAEVKLLSKLHHTHLIALIGHCKDSQEMILVYEYMTNGTLADHLYKSSRKGSTDISHLTWEQRLDISIGAACGLDYLHTGTNQSFIHRDVKTTNILLDEKWVAKIADFGLSKGTASHSTTHVTTDVKGTFGYLDPNYFLTHRLTKKSDVYAFGFVLLEVLCGRPPVDRSLEEEQISLIFWAQQCIKRRKIDRIIDPSLLGQILPDCLKYFVQVAKKCLHNRPKERPTMAEVVRSLEFALASQRKVRTEGMITKVFMGMNRWWREGSHNDSADGPSKQLIVDQRLRCFSVDEIREATNDFNEVLLIERSWDCHVYRGYLDGGTLVVAIKRFMGLTTHRLDEISDEIEIQSSPRHPHIVPLIGFCCMDNDLILVYEYMANGSLKDCLHGTNNDILPWKKRLEICIDAARGLQHLHGGQVSRVIHRAITSSHILLDEKWVAKVTNVTSSQQLPINNTSFPTSNESCYWPDSPIHPVYVKLGYGKITKQSEIYSFGVVLLEVLSADQKLSNPDGPWEVKILLDRFKSSIESETIYQVIDPNLIGKIAPECLRKFVNIALCCLDNEISRRPSIDQVVGRLQSALQLQETWEDGVEINGALPATDLGSYD